MKKIFLRILICILVMVFTQCIFSQKLLYPQPNSFQGRFLHYPLSEPGADYYTSRLLFDSKGFLWIGTGSALYRYDANRYKTYRFTSPGNSGFTGNHITSIYEDSAGMMWVGTFGALNCLDQKTGNVRSFIPDSGNILSLNNRIMFIHEDKSGILWLLTYKNVFSFNRKTLKFKKYSPEVLVSESWVNKSGQFLEDSRGVIWIASKNGLYRYSQTDDNFITCTLASSGPSGTGSNEVTSVREDASGNLWCSSREGGLGRIADRENGICEKIYFPGSARLRQRLDTLFTLFPAKNGHIWLFGNGLFADYFPETGELKSYEILPVNAWYKNSRGQSLHFEEAFQTDNESIWFYQLQGILFCFDPGSEKLTMFGVPNWIIFDHAIDKYGTVWFGCANGNTWRLLLNQVPYTSVQVSNMFDISVLNTPRIVEDPGNRVWLALSTGIYRIDNFDPDSFFDLKQIRLPIGDTVVQCITKDSDGNLWAALKRNRIVKINSSSDTFKTYLVPGKPEEGISNIIEDSFGNIWFISYHSLFLLAPGDEKIRQFTTDNKKLTGVLSEIIYDVLPDSKGNLWFAAFGNGVSSYNIKVDSIIYHFPESGKELQAGDYCIRIKEDSKGRLWFLFSSKGLYLLDNKTGNLKSVRLMDDFPVGIFFSDIFIDRANNLRIYHNYGLTVVDPDNGHVRNIPYKQQSGSYCSYQLSAGQILNLAGPLLKLFKDSIPANNVIPEVFITGLKINGVEYGEVFPLEEAITELNKIELKHFHNNLVIDLTALNYMFPENNRYKYFMTGIDNDTVFLNDYHSIEYKNINPGKYKFWFTGSNNDGLWNLQGKSIDIIIKPPLTRTVFAYFIYVLVFISLAGLFIKRHLNQLIKDKKNLENEVYLRTLELEKKNLQIEEMDKLKTRFFTEISHEIRTPLSLIIGPIDNLKAAYGAIEDTRRFHLMDMIKRNSMRLMNLINQLLDISRIDAGKMKITLSESDILKTVRILVYEYLSLAESRKIRFSVEIPDSVYITFYDKDKIEKIISNLLSNAFKFTPSYGTVLIEIEVNEQPDQSGPPLLVITVKDTGVGISKENLEKIFNRFYRVEGEWEKDGRGTGIGLSLTEEFVSLLHGKIEVSSEKDKGSVFTVYIPLGKEHLSHDEYVIVKANAYDETVYESETDQTDLVKEKEAESTKAQILVIEDNQDLRDFIKESLSKDYHVFTADNGRSGIHIAFSKIPDLVMTDIIMPDLDGIELCKRLKTDERTSHIPVIILTAKAETRIEGLTTGADDYITKPFDIKELKIRISNLLIQREKLRLKYGLIEEVAKTASGSDSIDENFMMKINQIVLENIEDFGFDVGVLQEKTGISRVQLYRKLKALTGLSPSILILNHRMKQAAKLIRGKSGNLTEIALSVGFSNPSYFSKCFKSFYGVSPRDFLNKPENTGKSKVNQAKSL